MEAGAGQGLAFCVGLKVAANDDVTISRERRLHAAVEEWLRLRAVWAVNEDALRWEVVSVTQWPLEEVDAASQRDFSGRWSRQAQRRFKRREDVCLRVERHLAPRPCFDVGELLLEACAAVRVGVFAGACFDLWARVEAADLPVLLAGLD